MLVQWKRFKGFYAARSKHSREPVHHEANQMARRLRERTGAAAGGEYKLDSEDEEDMEQREEEERQERIRATSHFHGIHFSDWMRVFIKVSGWQMEKKAYRREKGLAKISSG